MTRTTLSPARPRAAGFAQPLSRAVPQLAEAVPGCMLCSVNVSAASLTRQSVTRASCCSHVAAQAVKALRQARRIGVMNHACLEQFFGCRPPPIGFHSWIFAFPI